MTFMAAYTYWKVIALDFWTKIRILNEITKITEKQNYSIDIEASGKNKIKWAET